MIVLYFFFNKFDTNLFTSLSRNYYDHGFTQASLKYEKRISSKVAILLEGGSPENLKVLADNLIKEISDRKLLKLLNQEHFNTGLGAFYHSHRNKLLTSAQLNLIDQRKFKQIRETSLQNIYSPFSFGLQNLKDDPLLLMNDFYSGLIPNSNLTKSGKYFKHKSRDDQLLIFFDAVNGESSAAYEFLSRYNIKSPSKMYFTGASFYNEIAREQATRESSMFSTLSILLIIFVFWKYFRSFRQLIVCVVCLVFSVVSSMWICTFIFGELHILTILLGTCVLGIVSDYFIHFFMKEYDEVSIDGGMAFDNVFRPLFWSFGTTLVGFLSFIFFPLNLLIQFSLFASTSLIIAFLLVKYLLPHFFVPSKQDSRTSGIVWSEKIMILILKYSKTTIAITLVILIYVVGLKSFTLNSDIRTFSEPNETLKISELKIRKLLDSNNELGTFIVRGESNEELLLNEEKLKMKLRSNGVSVSAISDWIPSLTQQKKSIDSYKKLSPLMSEVSKQVGIKETDKVEFLVPFTVSDFQHIAMSHIINVQYIGDIKNKFYSVIRVSDLSRSVDLVGFNSAHWVYMNKVQFLNSDIESFSYSIAFSLMFFSFFLFSLVSVKFGVKPSLGILCTPILSVVLSCTILLLVFDALNLFHLLGFILIFVLGIDYSFFYFFNRSKDYYTAIAVEFSTLTTLSSFAILSFSSTFAVYSFGLSVFLGVLFCWVLSPYFYLRSKHE
jgi:predicted exporter